MSAFCTSCNRLLLATLTSCFCKLTPTYDSHLQANARQKPALFIFQCTCSLATACLFYHIVFSLSRLFQKFFEKVFNFLSTRTLFFPCSLALSTDDLIIIHSITPFVNTFFHFFWSFFHYTIYCGLFLIIYTICVDYNKKRTVTNRYSSFISLF